MEILRDKTDCLAMAAPRLSVRAAFSDKMRLALLAASGAWVLLASSSIWNCTMDDSYICYRYAQNLAHGFGLVFNRGERVEGYTDFLWVVLLAPGFKIASDPILTSKLLGVLFNLLALVACCYLCRILATEQAPMHGITMAVTATSAAFIADGVEGLEGALFVMLICWLTLAHLNGLRAEGGAQRFWLAIASLLSALLVMTRPDGALTYVLLWLHAAWRFRRQPRNLVPFSLSLVLVYGPYFLWRWHYYGLFFPNTFYAKGGGTFALYSQGAAAIASFLSLQSVGLLIALIIGVYIVLFPSVETTVLGLVVLSRFVFELWSGGNTAGSARFLAPVIPLIWLLTECLFIRWLGHNRLGVRGGYWLVAVFGLLLSAEVVQFARYRRAVLEPRETGIESAYIPAGKWLKANAQPGAAVAVGDIGAVGYFSGLRIIDTDGLTDTTISHSPGIFGEKGDAEYVLSRHPDYVILRVKACEPHGPNDVIMGLDRKLFVDPTFQNGFDRLRCWEFFPDYHFLLYKKKSTPGH